MLKRPKILVVGSLMMDLIASTTCAPKAGETVIGLKFQTAPGGKGANQAVQAARLGADVTMVGRVGKDPFGNKLIEAVSAAGVDISHISVDPNESSGVAQITLEVTEHGAENRITVCPGSNFTLTADHLSFLKEEIRAYDLVMMQFELPMDVIETVAQWAHDAGVSVMINPAPASPISDKLLSCAIYIAPNEHEAYALTNHSIDVSNGVNFEDVAAVVNAFQTRGAEHIIITLGENGSVLGGKDGIQLIDSVKAPHVVDTTAAGDSYIASFCTSLKAGLTEKEAMVFASYASALTVSRMGAMPSLPTLEEVQAFMLERGCNCIDFSKLAALRH